MKTGALMFPLCEKNRWLKSIFNIDIHSLKVWMLSYKMIQNIIESSIVGLGILFRKNSRKLELKLQEECHGHLEPSKIVEF